MVGNFSIFEVENFPIHKSDVIRNGRHCTALSTYVLENGHHFNFHNTSIVGTECNDIFAVIKSQHHT